MPLTEVQEDALRILDWLYSSDHRREGRTTVQAVAYIRAAARNPGSFFRVQDHAHAVGGSLHADLVLFDTIYELAGNDPEMGSYLRADRNRCSFGFFSSMPSTDWMPYPSRFSGVLERVPEEERHRSRRPTRHVNTQNETELLRSILGDPLQLNQTYLQTPFRNESFNTDFRPSWVTTPANPNAMIRGVMYDEPLRMIPPERPTAAASAPSPTLDFWDVLTDAS